MLHQDVLAAVQRTTFEITPAADLPDIHTFYAVPGLFAQQKLSLVLAPSGTGLTQFACYLAAYPPVVKFHEECPSNTLPQGLPGPEGLPDSEVVAPSVLLISQRDASDVLKPRLKSLGVDLRSILVLTEVTETLKDKEGYEARTLRPFRTQDHGHLDTLLGDYSCIRLVIIDNADLMFSDVNHPSRSQIQRRLACLQAVAQQRNVAIVLLASIPALSANPCQSRLLQTLQDACRCVCLLAPDLHHPEARLLFTLKNTVSPLVDTYRFFTAAPPPSNQFREDMYRIDPETGHPLHPEFYNYRTPEVLPALRQLLTAPATPLSLEDPSANPQPPATLSYPQYLARLKHPHRRGPSPIQHDFACEVLIDALRQGALPVGDLDSRQPAPNTVAWYARLAHLSKATITRAKKTLQITATRNADCWLWTLPPTIPTLSPAPTHEQPEIGNGQWEIGNGHPETGNAPLEPPHQETCAPSPTSEAQPLTTQALPSLPPPPANNLRTLPTVSPREVAA